MQKSAKRDGSEMQKVAITIKYGFEAYNVCVEVASKVNYHGKNCAIVIQ